MNAAYPGSFLTSFVKITVYLFLLLVFLFALRELNRHGPIHDYLFLFFAPLVSGAGVYFIERRGAGWFPLFFGLYLIFYRGLWRLTDLAQGFSWVIMFKAGCFVMVGAVIAGGVCFLAGAVGNPWGGSGKKKREQAD